MITATKFAVNSGVPDVDVIGWGPEIDDATAATLHKSVWQQLTEQAGVDIFNSTQAAK